MKRFELSSLKRYSMECLDVHKANKDEFESELDPIVFKNGGVAVRTFSGVIDSEHILIGARLDLNGDPRVEKIDVPVVWEVSLDEQMKSVIAYGIHLVRPEDSHHLEIEVSGLVAGTTYHFRFRVGKVSSLVGVVRTSDRPKLAQS